MNEETNKQAYRRGYSAGRKRGERDRDERRKRADEMEFWERAYIAILPIAMNSSGWTINDKQITSGDDKAHLAALWADSAAKNWRMRQ